MVTKAQVASSIGAGALAILLAFLPAKEGVRTNAYLDPLGIPTACMGHTAGVKLGQVYTMAECEAFLIEDIEIAHKILVRHVPKDVLEQMGPSTTAAFVSFIFNVGSGRKGVKDGFVTLKNGRQTTMLTALKAGEIERACMELPKWNKNRLSGITARRGEELRMCLTDLENTNGN